MPRFFSMPVFTSQLLLLIAPPAALCHPLSVSTSQGIYHPNTSIPGVEQFLGIPYAEPPVGALRFAAPVPYTSGNASQHVDATRYGPACLQDRAFEEDNGLSEDCLTLNIFRPATAVLTTTTNGSTLYNDDNNSNPPSYGGPSTPLLPVLVYIYGGANIGGQSRLYHAPNLVLHSLNHLPPPPPNHTTTTPSKPLLTVTLNYRTGGLGFLYNTPFARRGLLNTGLKDQRAALEWVRDNVRAFGGDPRRVTVFGQSAGSFDVWMQARFEGRRRAGSEEEGEEEEELFRGAIMESGGPGSLALRGERPENGDGFLAGTLAALGCPRGEEWEGALECLRGVGVAELMRVWYDPGSAWYNTLDEFAQLPVGFGVDGGEWVGGEDYWNESVAQIPMIIGTTLNEGSLYGRVPTGLATNETYLNQVVAKNLHTTDLALARPVVATYYNHTAAQNGRGYDADPTAPDSYYIGEALLGDAMQDIPRRINLARHASGADASNPATTDAQHAGPASAKTWGYRWAQKPPLSLFDESFYGFPPDVPEANKIRAGVLHASELGSVFGDVYGWPDAGERDWRVANLVQGMWISFAYDLDPNNHGIPNVPHWDNYDPLSAAIFRFEDQGDTRPGMVPDDMRLGSYLPTDPLFGIPFLASSAFVEKVVPFSA
ncbi:carboxylesterase type b protein [Diplodia corticola]|uniref:Carboxylic ester hydrolase n=1 Tax=Diplodia corticola TaxID=236234 RepID=A0A1J9SDU8_9PEZI|nr:carboxylesterase type b protein [Diplodia corticola]OJD38004.1 carboxylesterase type b protein [Diplodia corticola]